MMSVLRQLKGLLIAQVIGQQQSPLEIIVIKDGKELKLGMDINVNIK